MRKVIFSSIAALVLTTGIASANSILGADQSLYEAKGAKTSSVKTNAVSSTFDTRINASKTALPSVGDYNEGDNFSGPR